MALHCETCMQNEGDVDQYGDTVSDQDTGASGSAHDAGSAQVVSFVKGRLCECSKCWYVRRGSFKKWSQAEFKAKMENHAAVQDKWVELRTRVCDSNDKAKKVRHDKVDLEHLCRKVDEDFVTFFTDGEFVPLKDYVNEVNREAQV